MKNILEFLNNGVVNGKYLNKIFSIIKKKKIALIAINCIDTNTINTVLEAARISRSLVFIQFSFSSSIFFIGKYYNLKTNIENKNLECAIKGAILAAKYVQEASVFYKVPVILHTDHCIKENLKWIDCILENNIDYFKSYGKCLFSSHMIDLSTCSIKDNIEICSDYLSKMSKYSIGLEIELGCTGGEEDGLDNTNISNEKLYTKPKDILYGYSKLINISKNFTIAASFGNTHGVYKPGNVKLNPKILLNAKNLIKKIFKKDCFLNFVFHGGSGTSNSIILESINYGVVKINLDTDIQWNYWLGVLKYYKKNKKNLCSQLGINNIKNSFNPNKKYYDPRNWLKYSKKYVFKYIFNIFNILKCINLI